MAILTAFSFIWSINKHVATRQDICLIWSHLTWLLATEDISGAFPLTHKKNDFEIGECSAKDS